MSSRIYDVTRTLSPSIAVWPGDTPFSATVTSDMNEGAAANVTTITISSHCGTHVDAPYHFVNDEVSMEQVPLDVHIGPATVVTVRRCTDTQPWKSDTWCTRSNGYANGFTTQTNTR